MSAQCSIVIRTRYVECDPMGYLHHSCYLPYLEMGRTELLRQMGGNYRELEAQGFFFVVTKILINYKKPARYDDELELLTRITRQTPVRFEHEYELYHRESRLLLATAQTTIACVGRDGQVCEIPASLTAAVQGQVP
jgi:acyl-CoA thioester hydrolase